MVYNVVMIDEFLTSDLLRGHTDTMILKLLSGGDKYGFEIINLIHELSAREYVLKEATMYSSLKRLEHGGCIISYWGSETQGGRRKYYRLTATGQKRYFSNRRNWDYAKKLLEKLL